MKAVTDERGLTLACCYSLAGSVGWCTTARGLYRCRLSPLNLPPATGTPWLWSTTEAQEEEHFTFWIVAHQRTTVVDDSTGDYVGVYGP